jgi:hypothetical protein
MLNPVAPTAAPTEIWRFCKPPILNGYSEMKFSTGDVLTGQGYPWQNGGIMVAGINCEDLEKTLLRINLYPKNPIRNKPVPTPSFPRGDPT